MGKYGVEDRIEYKERCNSRCDILEKKGRCKYVIEFRIE